MSRLTKRFNDNSGYEVEEYGSKYNEVKLDSYFDAVDKLGRLEDIEEQIGCPLDVVFKALKHGIFTKNLPSEKIVKWYGRLSNVETEWYLSDDNKVCINLKGYKKTWWLREDRSE